MATAIPYQSRPAWALALELLDDRARQDDDGRLIVEVWQDSFFQSEVAELHRMGFLLPLPAPPADELVPAKLEYELISNWKEVRALRLASNNVNPDVDVSSPAGVARQPMSPTQRTDVAMFVDYDNMYLTGEKYPGEKFDLGRLMRLWRVYGQRLVVANLYTARLSPTILFGEGVDEEQMQEALENLQPGLLRRNFTLMEFIREGFRPIVLPGKINGGREGKDVDAAMMDDVVSAVQLLPSLRTVILATHDHAFQYLASRLRRMTPEIQVIAFVEDITTQIARVADGYVNVRSPLVRAINPLLMPSKGSPGMIAEGLISQPQYRPILEIIAHMVPILRRVYQDTDYIGSPSFLRNLVYADHEFTASKRFSEIEIMAVVKLLMRLGVMYQSEGVPMPMEREGEESEESESGTPEKPRINYRFNFTHPLLERLLQAADTPAASTPSNL